VQVRCQHLDKCLPCLFELYIQNMAFFA
jgi:hypothetical protein